MVQIIHAATIIVGNNGKVLYIPHGSDNTTLSPFFTYSSVNFISHMVQMIVVTSHQSLVPSHQSLVTVLFYIPHGSDNTQSKSSADDNL